MSIKVFRHSEEKHQKFEKYPEIISTDNRKLWKIRTNTVRTKLTEKKENMWYPFDKTYIFFRRNI